MSADRRVRGESQELAAEELVVLQGGSAIIEMLSDCVVMPEQARECQ